LIVCCLTIIVSLAGHLAFACIYNAYLKHKKFKKPEFVNATIKKDKFYRAQKKNKQVPIFPNDNKKSLATKDDNIEQCVNQSVLEPLNIDNGNIINPLKEQNLKEINESYVEKTSGNEFDKRCNVEDNILEEKLVDSEIVIFDRNEMEKNNLLNLPDEVLVLILLHVKDPGSLKDFSLTCQRILAIFQDSYVKEFSIRKFFVDVQGKCKKCRIIDGHYSSCIFHPRQPDPRLYQGEIKQISSSETCRKCKRIYYLCNCLERDLKTCCVCRAVMGHYSFCSDHKKNKLKSTLKNEIILANEYWVVTKYIDKKKKNYR